MTRVFFQLATMTDAFVSAFTPMLLLFFFSFLAPSLLSVAYWGYPSFSNAAIRQVFLARFFPFFVAHPFFSLPLVPPLDHSFGDRSPYGCPFFF